MSSSLLFLFLLETDIAGFVFLRLGLKKNEVMGQLRQYISEHPSRLDIVNPLYAKDFQEAVEAGLKIALKAGKKFASAGDLLIALAQLEPFLRKLLIDYDFKAAEIEGLVRFQENLIKQQEQRKRVWDKDNLALYGSIGRDLASGYTITLDRFGRDITKQAIYEYGQRLVDHQREMEEVRRILSRTTLNNILLVGRPGSGRKMLIKEFARLSYYGRLEPLLNYKRVVELNLPSLIAQIQNLEEAETALDKVFRETHASGNTILVINDFHDYVSASPRPGVLNIAGILSSYLAKSEFQLIATTTYVGLHEEIEKNPAVLSQFSKVEITELEEDETIDVLENWTPVFETRYKKLVTYPALRQVVRLGARYMADDAFPKKAVELLDEVMVLAANKPDHPFVVADDVDEVVTAKTEIPVGKIQKKEKEVLLNLEQLIHQRIINQDEAVSQTAEALRRARTEITVRKGPMGAFLFLGPTGVGKTETSKALAAIYFGSEERMIRLDMSEFQDITDIPRLIGSSGREGQLVTPVRENPFSLILLDEIEKAHPNILNLFLQVLDEGFFTDGMGRKVSFKNSIIIATSNAGAKIIWEDVRTDKKLDIIRDDLFSYFFEKGIFRPEFINRFDGVVIFKPLSRSNLLEIADLLFAQLKKNLAEKEIDLLVSPQVKEKVVDLGYNPSFGAREMRRVIQDKVENILAVALLQGKAKKGDKVRVELKENDQIDLIIEQQAVMR
ncbi:ATP-dependent Clp protease ATP-binding subunit [archaeon]|nr:ATP-dependent Clp protease ATP-binding subunit [archaeon]